MAISTSKIMSVVMILSLIVPSTLAKEYVVGDNLGWALDVNLQAWLAFKTFRVGDVLHFNFPSPHTVAVVDAVAYLACDASKAIINDVSGHFSYTLTQTGVVSFISAGPRDCAAGLKLQLEVLL